MSLICMARLMTQLISLHVFCSHSGPSHHWLALELCTCFQLGSLHHLSPVQYLALRVVKLTPLSRILYWFASLLKIYSWLLFRYGVKIQISQLAYRAYMAQGLPLSTFISYPISHVPDGLPFLVVFLIPLPLCLGWCLCLTYSPLRVM